jgi:hypothetical protein
MSPAEIVLTVKNFIRWLSSRDLRIVSTGPRAGKMSTF